MDKAAPPKEQPKVSTDPTIKSDKKKKDSELGENELNQATGGGWNLVPLHSDYDSLNVWG